MAGVSLAWLLDGKHDVVLLEARDSIGGNVRSAAIDLDGHQFVVDLGAQYFHPGPYPVYATLLRHLGLDDPAAAANATHRFPASITLTAASETEPRFVSPVLPERQWPFVTPWNLAGLGAFGIGFIAAGIREQLHESWDLSLEHWLSRLLLTGEQRDGMLLAWAASLFSGSIAQTRGLSARAAMIFAAKSLPPNPLDPLIYQVLAPGMIAAIDRMLAQCSTVQLLTSATVTGLVRESGGGFTIHRTGGPPVQVDDLVFASSGPASTSLAATLSETSAQVAALNGIEFHDARLALHTDPHYAPADPRHRSFFNCHVDGEFCEASMWLASVLPGAPPATAAKLWKSWITHRDPPDQILQTVDFTHMLPTVDTLRAQRQLSALQGSGGIWFAGGYLYPYDAQETALLSALRIARGLHVLSSRSQLLLSTPEHFPLEL
jgi:predicted NAD/FAD-binding protein